MSRPTTPIKSYDLASHLINLEKKKRLKRSNYGEINNSESTMTTEIDVDELSTLTATPPTPSDLGPRRPPLLLEWHNLEYNVLVKPQPPPKATFTQQLVHKFTPHKKIPKPILHKMSGYVKPGSILAIMGQSGSGKTSLLNILSQRVRHYEGDILVNKVPVTKSFRAASAFVQQDDVLLGNLTIRENLRYAAMLRLGSNVSMADKMKRIDSIMLELGLTKSADTRIGIPGVTKGVSGGERKRTSIGMELLTEPSILFLDEPTSGLDAKTSKSVMETLAKLAKTGLSVVLTIHQPRSDIFHMFDKLLLLARGSVVYFGDADNAVPYFANLGYQCPPNYNPADFFVDLISEVRMAPSPVEIPDVNVTDTVRRRRATRKLDQDRVTHMLETWGQDHDIEAPDLSNSMLTVRRMKKLPLYRSSWIVQFVTLLTRQYINVSRDTAATFMRATQMLILAIVVGLLFFRIDMSQSRIRDRIGVVFFIVINQTMYTYTSALTTFMSSKAVYMRERGAKIYRVSAYYLAVTLAELPNAILFNLIYGTIAYWMVNLNPSVDRFFFFLLIIVVQSLAMQAYGNLTAIAAPTFPIANTVGTFATTILALTAGFWMSVATIPPWAIWLTYISVQHYAFEALVLNEFTGRIFDCPPAPDICQQPTGETVIQNLALDTYIAHPWAMVGFLLLLTVVARTLAFLLLRFVRRPKGI